MFRKISNSLISPAVTQATPFKGAVMSAGILIVFIAIGTLPPCYPLMGAH